MVKRAQGLPLNLIVLAIIAALVLVLIIAFTVGGAGSTFSRIFKVGTTTIGDEVDSVRAACRNACNNAELSVQNGQQWVNAEYCKKKINIDKNGNGKLDVGETDLKCWQDPVIVSCQFSVGSTALSAKSPDLRVPATAACDPSDIS